MSKTLDRIRKLLALANNAAAAPNEADSARAMADALMAAAGITDGDLNEAGEVDPLSTVRAEGRYAALSPTWWRSLAGSAALVMGCRVYRATNRLNPHYGKMVWIGTDAQREAGQAMHEWLVRTVNRLATRFPGTRTEKTAYRTGVAVAVHEQAKVLYTSRPAEVGAALARRDELKSAIASHLPKLARARVVRIDAGGAFAAGQAAGASITLQARVSGSGPRRLGSGS